MKKCLVLLGLTIAVSCSQRMKNSNLENAEKKDTLLINSIEYTLDSIGENEYNSNAEIHFDEKKAEFINDTNVIREDSLLIFRLKSGSNLVLKNDTSVTNYIEYKFLQSYNSIDYWLIRLYYYEGSGYLLLDKETGEKIDIYGEPKFSGNKNYFFTSSFDIEATYDPNGFELYQLVKGKAKRLWRKDIDDWGPSGMKWINDSCVVIEQSRVNYEANSTHFKLSYKRMKIIK
jgi:hypothetical protein